MFNDVDMITTSAAADLVRVPADYFFSPWWFLGALLVGVFVLGMIYGMGTVIGWKELAQKIRLGIFSLRIRLQQ